MSNFMNTYFGPLNKEWCIYFQILSMFFLFMFVTSLPNFLKRTVYYILEKFTSEKRLAERLRSLHDKNHEEINELY